MFSRSSLAAPRGQNTRPTPRLTAKPIATSSIRMSPTFQPTGWMMLKRIRMTTVNAAWPAAHDPAGGAKEAEDPPPEGLAPGAVPLPPRGAGIAAAAGIPAGARAGGNETVLWL